MQIALELCDRMHCASEPGERHRQESGREATAAGRLPRRAPGEEVRWPAAWEPREKARPRGWPAVPAAAQAGGCALGCRPRPVAAAESTGGRGSGRSLPPGVSFLGSKFAACGITRRPRMLLTGPPRATAGPTPPRPSVTRTAEGGHGQTGTFTLKAGPVPKTISQGAVTDVRERVPSRGGAAPGQTPQQKRRQRPDSCAQGEIRERHLAPGNRAPLLRSLDGGTQVGTGASRAESQGLRPLLCARLPQGRLAKF